MKKQQLNLRDKQPTIEKSSTKESDNYLPVFGMRAECVRDVSRIRFANVRNTS